MACYNLIAASAARANNDSVDQPIHPDAFYKRFQRFIVNNFERLIGKGMQIFEGNNYGFDCTRDASVGGKIIIPFGFAMAITRGCNGFISSKYKRTSISERP